MHSELQTLVDAGAIPPTAARALDTLPPGAYCQHKSWGFGQVAAWSLGSNQILIDFGPRKSHPMQLTYAAETLQPLPPDHFLVRKAQDLPGTKRLATEEPAALVASILTHAPGRRAIATQVLASLVPDLFTEAEAKRWWENAKKALKKDGRFNVPAKKTEFIELRSPLVSSNGQNGPAGGVTAEAHRMVHQFQASRRAKDQLAALDALSKEIEPLRAANADLAALLEPVLTAASVSANQNARLDTTKALELLITRDDIAAAAGLTVPEDAPTLAGLLRTSEPTLASTLDALPAARQRAAVLALPAAFGEDGWPARVFQVLPLTRHPRVIGEAAKLFETQGRMDELARFFDRCLRDYTVSCEMLLWLCREHDSALGKSGPFQPLFAPRLFTAILSALDRDRFGDVKRGTRLRELLLNDRTLGPTLLKSEDAGARRTAARVLLSTSSMEELDKRSLMARLIRSYPELGSLLGGAGEDKGEGGTPLIVSWSSLEKRKEEYDKLVNKDIPKNSQEIGLARSYGDLRENFEFKAAKEMQTVLMRRKAELEQALARSRGTNFENPDLSQVSIGTVVTLSDPEGSGEGETFTILGAWDGAPEEGIISYQTAIGQALLGHRVGETVELMQEGGGAPRKLRIESIQAYRAVALAV